MERLWSPWRLAYVTGAVGAGSAGSNVSCIFCDASAESSRDDLVLIRTPLSYVILNLYPVQQRPSDGRAQPSRRDPGVVHGRRARPI